MSSTNIDQETVLEWYSGKARPHAQAPELRSLKDDHLTDAKRAARALIVAMYESTEPYSSMDCVVHYSSGAENWWDRVINRYYAMTGKLLCSPEE